MPQIDDMPFFSIGYADKERLEVVLIDPAADSKSEGYDWIKGLVRIEVGRSKASIDMRKIILILSLCCCCGLTVQGQNPTPPVTNPPTRPGKVATYYNAAKDITSVLLGFSDVGGESPCGLYVSANSFYAGKTATQPSQIKLIIMRITPEDKIKSAPLRDLSFSVDGEVLNLGLMETANQQSNMDLRLETLESSLPYDQFMKIANAKTVEGKLGSAKFRLTDDNLTFLRAFASRFKL